MFSLAFGVGVGYCPSLGRNYSREASMKEQPKLHPDTEVRDAWGRSGGRKLHNRRHNP